LLKSLSEREDPRNTAYGPQNRQLITGNRYYGCVPTAASHPATDKGKRTPSTVKRIGFAVFFAVIATGLTFYIVLFASMYGALGTGKLNPAMAPGVDWSLRDIGVPASVAAGVLVFALTMWRGRTKRGF
jgi:hypothetical protein